MKVCLLVLLSLTMAWAWPDHHEHHHHHDHGAAYVVKTHGDLIRFRNVCTERVHADEEDIAKYKKWDFPDNEKTRCYIRCVFEHFGFFDEVTGFDVHKVHEQLAGSKGEQVDHTDDTHQKVANCADSNEQKSDACTWAYRGAMCFMGANLQLVQHSVKV
ncbi:Odorant-binding protein 99b [Drosophila willistoni]|uniref:Odorant-binding protein 99b n=1 Tax=Drosophila willistoni TaxID=7260 RepID=B4NBK1_DROWI|nr:general odorant-binding protein 99b [Drosophila willistoni]EDW81165.1 Odorant-binding protein 99b [Drosophila willistoni]